MATRSGIGAAGVEYMDGCSTLTTLPFSLSFPSPLQAKAHRTRGPGSARRNHPGRGGLLPATPTPFRGPSIGVVVPRLVQDLGTQLIETALQHTGLRVSKPAARRVLFAFAVTTGEELAKKRGQARRDAGREAEDFSSIEF